MIVLDTHALVWWVNGNQTLSSNANEAIKGEFEREDGLILVSAISAWEISMLCEKGRLTMNVDVQDWLDLVADIDAVRFEPITPALAVQSTRLPGDFHADPADRMIVALARHRAAPLITADAKIQAYPHVKTLW